MKKLLLGLIFVSTCGVTRPMSYLRKILPGSEQQESPNAFSKALQRKEQREQKRAKALEAWFGITAADPVKKVRSIIENNTALWLANEKEFRNKEAFVNVADKDGNTLLHKLVIGGLKKEAPLYDFLVKQGAETAKENAQKMTVGQIIALGGWKEFDANTSVEEVNTFITEHEKTFEGQKASLIDSQDDLGNSLLHRLCLQNVAKDHPLVTYLIDTHSARTDILNENDYSVDQILKTNEWFSLHKDSSEADIERCFAELQGAYGKEFNVINLHNNDYQTLLMQLQEEGCDESHVLIAWLFNHGAGSQMERIRRSISSAISPRKDAIRRPVAGGSGSSNPADESSSESTSSTPSSLGQSSVSISEMQRSLLETSGQWMGSAKKLAGSVTSVVSGTPRKLSTLAQGFVPSHEVQQAVLQTPVRLLASAGSIVQKKVLTPLNNRFVARPAVLEKWFAFTPGNSAVEIWQFVEDNKGVFDSVGDLVNAKDADGDTLLHGLICHGINENDQIVATIIALEGYDPEIENASGDTVEQAFIKRDWLSLAQSRPTLEQVTEFLAAYTPEGVVVEMTDLAANTCLHLFAYSGLNRQSPAFRYIVEKYPQLLVCKNENGYSPDQVIALTVWHNSFTAKTAPEQVENWITNNEVYFSSKADLIDSVPNDGITLLHTLVLGGIDDKHPLYTLLIRHGASVSRPNADGNTVESLLKPKRTRRMLDEWNRLDEHVTENDLRAFMAEYRDIARSLSTLVNKQDDNGDTLLHKLARAGQGRTSPVFKLLADSENFFDFTLTNKKGETVDQVLAHVQASERDTLRNTLVKDWDALDGRVTIVELKGLIAGYIRVSEDGLPLSLLNRKDVHGDTILHRLAHAGHTRTSDHFIFLQAAGCDPMIKNSQSKTFDEIVVAVLKRRRDAGVAIDKPKSSSIPKMLIGSVLGALVAYAVYKKYEEMKRKKASETKNSGPDTQSGKGTFVPEA